MFDAEFSYKMRGETLVIYDADIGGKSVTNDMENVLMRIIKEIGKPDHDTPVVYMDSQGDFAGVLYWPVTRQVKFIGLGDTTNEKEAVEAMQQHMEGLKNG